MRIRYLIVSAALALANPAVAREPAPGAAAESKADHSAVSLLVDPKLDDGRLVIKLAAENRTATPVAFGPASIAISKLNGQPVALMSLQQLTNDVRLAAGMQAERAPPTASAYATQAMSADSTGRLDVTNYTGSMAVSGNEIIRQSNAAAGDRKPTISKAQAEQQIAALKQAVLQDSTVQPGQVVAGEVVSAPLTFAKGEERTLHIWVKIAGDEHTFTVAAAEQ